MTRSGTILAAAGAAILLSCIPAWAAPASADAFFRRFEITKDASGKPDLILIKGPARAFSLEPLYDDIRADLYYFQANAIGDGENLVGDLDPDDLSSWPREYRELARAAIKALPDVDIDGATRDPRFRETMRKFEDKLRKHLVGYKVVANLNDPRYFYSRAAASQLLSYGLRLVERQLRDSSYLELARVIVNRAVDMIQGRRVFHQNMLLHYLEKSDTKALGLASEDTMKAKSSVFESQVPWFAFWVSNSVQTHWLNYGNMRFEQLYEAASEMLLNNQKSYETVGDRVDFAFSIVKEKGRRKIVNLLDRKYIFSSKPSDAFFFDNPKKVARERLLYKLIQLGLGYVPDAHWAIPVAKNACNTFIESMYVAQEKTEGALLAYFESSGQASAADALRGQSANPYLSEELQ